MCAGLEEAERLTAEDAILSKRMAMARKMYRETQESLGKIKGR